METADIADGADHFTIDQDGVLKFSSPPDLRELRQVDQGATSNTYKVVVLAADAETGGQTGYYKATVMVTDVDEPGEVTWTVDPDGAGTLTANVPPAPPIMQFQIGAVLTASATDGDVAGAAKAVANPIYRWYRGSTEIDGATTNAYTVAVADVGHNIRVVVTYVVAGSVDQESASLTSDLPRADDAGRRQRARVRPDHGRKDCG